MDEHIFNKTDDNNITLCIYATLIESYYGPHISVHSEQPWAYKFQVPHWSTPNNIILARGENELQIGMGYMLNGFLSINEGKDWTRTAFEVDDVLELGGPADHDALGKAYPGPQFRMSGLVLEADNQSLVLGWERYDDDLGNFAWVYVKLTYENAAEDMLHKKYWVEGDMNGPDRMNDWIAVTVTEDV